MNVSAYWIICKQNTNIKRTLHYITYIAYVTLSRIMLHINFGPSLDTKHLRERGNLELKYKKLSKTLSD